MTQKFYLFQTFSFSFFQSNWEQTRVILFCSCIVCGLLLFCKQNTLSLIKASFKTFQHILLTKMSNNTKKSRIVETQNGPVQGKTFTFEDNREATAFLGIPFGKPPVGELRFKVRSFLD